MKIDKIFDNHSSQDKMYPIDAKVSVDEKTSPADTSKEENKKEIGK